MTQHVPHISYWNARIVNVIWWCSIPHISYWNAWIVNVIWWCSMFIVHISYWNALIVANHVYPCQSSKQSHALWSVLYIILKQNSLTILYIVKLASDKSFFCNASEYQAVYGNCAYVIGSSIYYVYKNTIPLAAQKIVSS